MARTWALLWPGPVAALADGPPTEPRRGLLEAEPEGVVKPGGKAPGMGADLADSSPEGISGLLGMPALDPLLAPGTAPDPHGEPGDHRSGIGQLAGELLGVPDVDDLTTAVRTQRRHGSQKLPVDRTNRHGTMTVAPVVLPRTPGRPGRFLCRVALGERCRLALPRTPAVLLQLLQLGDAGITGSERLGQLGDPGFEADDRCGQLSDRAGVSTWRGVAGRNSQRYARASARWWTPLSKYLFRSVFEDRAPAALSGIEALTGLSIGQGTAVRELLPGFLSALTAAYEEAAGTSMTVPAAN